MTFMHYAGAILVLILITLAGAYSGHKVKSASDFSYGGRSAGIVIVIGGIVGAFVGGAATIGTAQLAFDYGFSAWWYTLGGGLGFVLMGAFFVEPMYKSGMTTISQMIAKEYGGKVAALSVVLMSMGTFVAIISQLVAGTVLITSVSSAGPAAAVCIVVVLTLIYVIFGGVWGAGYAGAVKTVLLYILTMICGAVSLKLAGGISAVKSILPVDQYFSLFARGCLKDGGEGLSVIFGVISTQTYILPIISAKDLKTAKTGALAGGVLITLIGIAGIAVGLFMKISAPEIASSEALPLFAMNCLPEFIGGVILATLLISIVGSSAAMALGMTSMLCSDIYLIHIAPNASDKKTLRFSCITIVAVLILTALFRIWDMDSVILNFGYLSMALRASVSFAPLCFALLLPGRVKSKYAMAAIMAGPLFAAAGKLFSLFGNTSLFLGVAAALVIMLFGYFKGAYN